MVAIWMTELGPEVDVLAKYEIHPAADLFPLIEGPEFDAMVEDIATHGLLESIVFTPDGRLLDGRNRMRACDKAGVEPTTRVHEGNPWEYVISANVMRRHLSETQRAMIAAKMAERHVGQRARSDTPIERSDLAPTQKEAAELFNIGHSSISRARRVMNAGTPALIHAVEDDYIPVSTAERVVAALGTEEQDDYVAQVRAGANPKRLSVAMGVPSEADIRAERKGKIATAAAEPMTSRHTRRHEYVTLHQLATLRDTLAAMVHVLEEAEGGLDPAITSEEAARWVGDLSGVRVAVSRVLKLLNERNGV